MIETANLTNHFLIAMPAMGDPNFSRTVTYLCQHSEGGALGIVINRPTDMRLEDIIQQMDITIRERQAGALPIYLGGPVQPERGFVIHEPVGSWDSTLPITDSLALTTSRDILEAIALGEGPEKVLIALGYAGWGEGQLEREIMQNAWLSAPVRKNILFDMPAKQRWKASAEQMGINLDLLSSQMGHS